MRNTAQRIYDLIAARGPMPAKAIAAALDLRDSSVRKRLYLDRDRAFAVAGRCPPRPGGGAPEHLWTVAGPRPERIKQGRPLKPSDEHTSDVEALFARLERRTHAKRFPAAP